MMPGGAQLDDAGMGERIMKEALKETLTKLRNLSAWSPGWNSYDSLAPNIDAATLPKLPVNPCSNANEPSSAPVMAWVAS